MKKGDQEKVKIGDEKRQSLGRVTYAIWKGKRILWRGFRVTQGMGGMGRKTSKAHFVWKCHIYI